MNGKFIVIEGLDGSGKGTQTRLLINALRESDILAESISFPQHDTPPCHFVDKYLRGEYGEAHEVGPFKSSLFYALDRFDASFNMKKHLQEGKILIADRYETTNRAYQGQKIEDAEQRRLYFEWIKQIEYDILEIPKADLVIFLHVDPQISQRLVGNKDTRDYTRGESHDIHEKDIELLRRAEQVYLQLAKDPEWVTISCVRDGELLSKEDIHGKVVGAVQEFLNNHDRR